MTLTSEYILQLLAEEQKEAIHNVLTEYHSNDIAELLGDLPDEAARKVFALMGKEQGAEVLSELEEDVREHIVEHLGSPELVTEYIEFLDSDDAADIINELHEDQRKDVLAEIKDFDHASDIADLLNYDEETVGSIMAKELIQVNSSWSVIQCLKEMRAQAEDVSQVYSIYVVDDKDKLIGLLSLKTLLLAHDKATIQDIFFPKVISCGANEPKEEATRIMQRYDLIALPVVDDLGRLVGRVTIDDAVDIIQEEAEKDYQMASGISEDIESDDSVKDITRARLPWLMVGLLGGILGAVVMDFFGIEEKGQLALFAPLVAAMGGNVGVQSAAIIVQGLATSNLGKQTTMQRLAKETIIGLINGIACAIVVFFLSYLIVEDWRFSQVLSVSIICVIIFAALFGTFVPLTLHRFKIDPALATGPFITTANDVFGLCIYFGLALWWLS